MSRTAISPSLAARILAARFETEDMRPALTLELPPHDRQLDWSCETPAEAEESAPYALVLEADGTIVEVRD